jgi:hypothetical protein
MQGGGRCRQGQALEQQLGSATRRQFERGASYELWF